MSLISLQNSSELEVTILSNRFIDNFMPRANGEFVKVYIYLLRMVSAAPSSFSLEHMADSLFCTERDISRALKYWEGEKLIALTYTADQKLSGITLLEPFADTGHRESSASVDTFTGSGNSASVSGNTDPGVPSSADYILSLTPDRIRELKQNEEISQLLYITEQYLTKTLTPTEMQKILFFYDELHMSADLIEYLVEYCVSRGRKSMRYIETVALAWAKDGITTVEMARDASSRFSKDYYTILKAMGISGRNPVDNEITYIDTWRKTYGFDLELIQEACSQRCYRLARHLKKCTRGKLEQLAIEREAQNGRRSTGRPEQYYGEMIRQPAFRIELPVNSGNKEEEEREIRDLMLLPLEYIYSLVQL